MAIGESRVAIEEGVVAKQCFLQRCRMSMDTKIKEAINVLKQGGVVIYPTDTAFGIGCRIDNEDAVQRVFSIRNRPVTQAMPVLVDTVTMAKRYVIAISQEVKDRLIERYWPGGLTIVFPCLLENVPALVRGGGVTIGLRIPNHQTTRALIRGLGVPLLGPSANFHGGKTPYSFAEIDPGLYHLVDYILPGVTKGLITSTVIDVTKKPWQILREGAVKVSMQQESRKA